LISVFVASTGVEQFPSYASAAGAQNINIKFRHAVVIKVL